MLEGPASQKALQLRANIYPRREFMARGKQDTQMKNYCHCHQENETCSHSIGYCPVMQNAGMKRHNHL